MITPNTTALNSSDKAVALKEIARLMYEVSYDHYVPYATMCYFGGEQPEGGTAEPIVNGTYQEQGYEEYHYVEYFGEDE